MCQFRQQAETWIRNIVAGLHYPGDTGTVAVVIRNTAAGYTGLATFGLVWR